MVSSHEEHLLLKKYIEIFYSKNKKVHLLKIFQFLCILHRVFLLGTLLIHAVLIRKSVLNKNKFNYSQNTANYLISLHDNEMIFTSFDAADISALRYVKKKFLS
jgi:hypothetical protein